VPFTTKDISADPALLDELEKLTPGARSVPVIVIDGQAIQGFDRTKLQKALGLQ
jgi:glutaredoxin